MPKPSSDKAAIIYTSHKGGVGTSHAACLNLHLLRAAGHRVGAYDGDSSVGRTARLYGTYQDGKLAEQQDSLTGCFYFDVLDHKQRDVVLEAATLDADVLLFDLPSGTVQELGHIFGSRDDTASVIGEFSRRGWSVTIVNVITPETASIASVADSLDTFGDAAHYVVVMNLHMGDVDDFTLWHGTTTISGQTVGGNTKAKIEQLAASGRASIVTLPRLKPSTALLADINSLALEKLVDDKRIPIADQSRIFRWLASAQTSFTAAGPLLGFAPATADKKADKAGRPSVAA